MKTIIKSFLITLTFFATSFTDSFQYPDFKSWDLACSILPYFRVVGPVYNFKAVKLDWKEMEKALKEYAQITQTALTRNVSEWVGLQPPHDFFDLSKTQFWPYAQKLRVPVGSTVAFHGDIHGDIHSLLLYLKALQNKGYLDSVDAFKIKDPSFFMIFLGDYTDRGIYGAEVIYTLLRLKISNPDRVFLVRGNHEDHSINAHYGFEKEMKEKFGHRAHLKTLYNFYNLLPVVLYLGSGEQNQINYLQCCHGGMEIGYLPTNLLAYPGTVAYEHIHTLAQKTNMQLVYPTRASEDLMKNFVPTNPQEVGFLWNDFYLWQGKEAGKEFFFEPNRGWYYGRDITNAVLAKSGTAGSSVVGVIRAHQHDRDMTGMMGLILDRNYPNSLGVGKLWREQNNTGKDSLWPGIVCTFNLSPDTPQGASRRAGFNFDTYGLLKTGALYPQDWSLTVHRIYQQFTGDAITLGRNSLAKEQAT